MKNKIDLGASLRATRKAAGLTQQDLAEKAGLSTQIICKIERGRSLPNVSTLVLLADALDIYVSELVRPA